MFRASLRTVIVGASLLWGARGGVCAGAGDAIDQTPDTWVEVRSGHFVVASNAGESEARRIALEFERVRGIFHAAFPKFRVDPAQPIVILQPLGETRRTAIWLDPAGKSGLFAADGTPKAGVRKLLENGVQVVGMEQRRCAWQTSEVFAIPGGRMLHVVPKGMRDQAVVMSVKLMDGSRALVDTDVRLQNRGVMLFGVGQDARAAEGALIIMLRAED